MKKLLEQKIKKALEALQQAGILPLFVLPAIRVERPKDDQFGEYTTNIALALAKEAKKNPMEIAELLKDRLFDVAQSENRSFQKIEVVAPGYLNFYCAQKKMTETVEQILREGSMYGTSTFGQGEKVNNEFISANPTGPLTVGNGRGGFYADALSHVLRKAGYEVTNEYYVNDAGEQVLKLGHSVLKDSEAVYGGEYIESLHRGFNTVWLGDTNNKRNYEEYKAIDGRDDLTEDEKVIFKKSDRTVREIGEWAAKEILEKMIKVSVNEKMKIRFDDWTSEKKLYEDLYVEKAITILKEKKLTFEQDGALWLRTTQFGDDKDRVLVKSDGSKTYFASDAGYILHKMERGFTTLIETWGADHHGYINRFKAVAQALGFQGKIHFLIVQLVKVVKDGVEVRMSKRAGNVVTIDELIETAGHDVARFFFLMYAPETHMNFDLGLAEERSQKNPVFYVQYAHARLCSILRKAEEEGFVKEEADLTLLTHEKERQLMRELLFFPELIETVATDFSVHRLPQYAMKLADTFHSFYDACRVIESGALELTRARLHLVRATKIVLTESLTLMGISAPEKM